MRDYVVFKGSRNGLQLLLDETAEFEVLLEHLKSKLEAAIGFFTNGATVMVANTSRVFTSEQQADLSNLLAIYGLTVLVTEKDDTKNTNEDTAMDEILLVNKILRNGQEIVHSGSVIIKGDVNPGATVIAGGDIIIEGTCRGIVHAGAYGDVEATITADRLLASQIRIAGLIARAPDNLGEPGCTETARIQDGAVVIKPTNNVSY